ncbi:MAG: aldo/keto reductase [Staphylococcus epidermidis]|nr:aldo/keto reductase [Staphylococcus epidermidis]
MVKQVRLGKSDVNVFPIALGTNAVGGHNLYPNLDEEQGKEVVRQAIDNGITLLDTAYIYGPERSEELVGQVVKEYPREKVQIATKGSHVIKENEEVVQNNDPEYLKQQVENSLERLQVDYIDLYYIHFPDDDTPKDKAYAAENNITFVPYFPLASGILAGKYDENQTFEDHRAERPDFQPDVFKDNVRRVKALTDIAEAHDTTIANVVLAFYLTRPSLDVVIPGAKRAEQVVENIDAANIELSQGEIDKIDSLFPIKK